MPLAFNAVHTEGIAALTLDDLRFASELGYSVRHLGIAMRRSEGVELRVHPCLVPKAHMLAQVGGVMNAVMVGADAAGPTLYYGAGAGAGPTASAVMADLMDLARCEGDGKAGENQGESAAGKGKASKDKGEDAAGKGKASKDKGEDKGKAAIRLPNLGFSRLATLPLLPMDRTRHSCYLRIAAEDKAGVMAQVSSVLSSHEVSIEALIQKDARGGDATIAILTNEAPEAAMNRCCQQIAALAAVQAPPTRIRLAHL